MELPGDFGEIQAQVNAELFKNVLKFWSKHSEDREHGGFFSCLDESGEIYDSRKFMWLNGRQIWMYARICSSVHEEELTSLSDGFLHENELLSAAAAAADFMTKNGIRGDGMVYFSLAQDGSPYHFERKIFSACFLAMGLATLSAHSLPKAEDYRTLALRLLNDIISWAHDPTPLGRTKCDGAPPTSPLNVPMILLNILDEFRLAGLIGLSSDPVDYSNEEKWCIEEILKHVITDKKIVLENVHVDGSVLPGYDGRHMNPGHAIECGWFLYNYAKRTDSASLKAVAVNMIEWSFHKGWDSPEHGGGLLYFLDSEGRSPPYLEWSMKLWWPHTEALIAYAVLFEDTRKEEYWEKLKLVWSYIVTHFSDAQGGGEWFGYLDRDGNPTHRFKGGPYKGCFHVPRALFFVSQIFKEMLKGDTAQAPLI